MKKLNIKLVEPYYMQGSNPDPRTKEVDDWLFLPDLIVWTMESYCVLFSTKSLFIEFDSGEVLFKSVKNTIAAIVLGEVAGRLVTNCWNPVLSALNPLGIEVVLTKVPLSVYISMIPLICLPTVSESETK